MNLRVLVWRELRERPWSVFTSGIAILLGVAALIGIWHLNVASEQQVSRQLETLGANILVLPKATTLQDYYAADISTNRMPEEYAMQILLASLPGVEKLSPKLCVPIEHDGQKIVVTGILPQRDFQAASAIQSVGVFQPTKHVGCAKAHTESEEDSSIDALTRRRTIQDLGKREVVLGGDAAAKLGLNANDHIALFNESFRIVGVLPATGTIDDGRIFAHLHTVQDLNRTGEVVSAIEIIGCCEDAAGQLVPRLSSLLPDTKVVTISQVVETQVNVNRLMAGTSWFVLGVLVFVGAASVASVISANVRERRREIGTLMAMGAQPRLILKMFLLKAAWVGLSAGLLGCTIGIVFAVVAGPNWLGVPVWPLWGLSSFVVLCALLVAVAAAYWPAHKAARLDPCHCFREV